MDHDVLIPKQYDYCPKCLTPSLSLKSRGVILIYINDLKLDTGKILFNASKETPAEIFKHILKKIDDHLLWLSKMKNRPKITLLKVVSADFYCENRCSLPMHSKFNVLAILSTKKEFLEKIKNFLSHHELEAELDFFDEIF